MLYGYHRSLLSFQNQIVTSHNVRVKIIWNIFATLHDYKT